MFSSKLRNIITVIITIYLLLFYTKTISHDFYSYSQTIFSISSSLNVWEAIINHRYEPVFTGIIFYLSGYLSSNMIFYSFSILSILIKFKMFTKYLEYPLFAWLIYLVVFLPILEGNQLRGALSSIFILYVLLSRSNKISFVLNFIFGSIFHYLSAMILLIKFYKNPIFIFLFSFILTFVLKEILLFLSNDFFYFDIFFNPNPNSANLLTFMTLSQFLISIFTIMYWNNLNIPQKKGALLLILGLLFYILFKDNPLIAHRIREISMLGIFPLFFSDKFKINTHTLMPIFGLLIIIGYNLINIFIRYDTYYN